MNKKELIVAAAAASGLSPLLKLLLKKLPRKAKYS